MGVYAAVLAGVTVVVLFQLARLRRFQHRDVSPQVLAHAEAERQAVVDAALARAGLVDAGWRLSHTTAYGWPSVVAHVASDEAAAGLQSELERLRTALAAELADRGRPGFDASLGVVFQVDG